MTGRSVDVLVAGGGPAGSTAARTLSQRGLSVLLVDDGAPANYDVTISGAAFVMSGASTSAARRLDDLELVFGAQRRRTLSAPDLYAYDWRSFREQLLAAAIASGATKIDGRVDQRLRVRAAAGEVFAVDARHVVIATGAAHVCPPGIAVSQRMRGVDLGSGTALHFSTPAVTDTTGRMACARIVPGPDGMCTVTVTALHRPVDLFHATLAEIRDADPRFDSAEPIGPVVSAPVNASFSPDTCVHNGQLLVGGAAGLTNPFTGEGISYATQSGATAATCIADHPDDPIAAAAEYRRRTTAAYVGYFETARHTSRRYHLAWRALGATLHTDGTFFTKARRALILPEGLDRLSGRHRIAVPAADSLLVKAFLANCDAIQIAAVRTEWPFLARLFAASEGEQLRPAVPFLAATLCAGGPPPANAAAIAAGIELASLAMLAFIGAPADPRRPARGVDWACATRVLAGDFLIAVAAKLVAGAGGPRFSWSFAEWLTELIALRTRQLDRADDAAAVELFGSLFEFPCRIGAELAEVPSEAAKTLREYGYECGRAFLFAEDLAALRGKPNRLDTDLAGLLTDRISSFPDLLGNQHLTAAALAGDELRTAAGRAVETAMTKAYDRALDQLAGLPERPAGILRAFAATVRADLTERKR
ncbi:FAD-dependent oxidoreductase [Fodinicola acaciae]|uniref:FAD-dependent oxidoreductase n=1 Tax=Fodinicola acaciae TaxID=2681555 RepID=UPI0013D25B9F|nr:FAD-dependent oxidoreductase [Fodinicola acaciae]